MPETYLSRLPLKGRNLHAILSSVYVNYHQWMHLLYASDQLESWRPCSTPTPSPFPPTSSQIIAKTQQKKIKRKKTNEKSQFRWFCSGSWSFLFCNFFLTSFVSIHAQMLAFSTGVTPKILVTKPQPSDNWLRLVENDWGRRGQTFKFAWQRIWRLHTYMIYYKYLGCRQVKAFKFLKVGL